MKQELQRRQSLADQLVQFLRDRPCVWIDAVTLEQFGRQAWRTRISEARKVFMSEGGALENRQRRVPLGTSATSYVVTSEYRYVPNPLGGRDAATFVPGNPETGTLFDTYPTGWHR